MGASAANALAPNIAAALTPTNKLPLTLLMTCLFRLTQTESFRTDHASDNFSAGVVFTPTPDLMFSIDWWRIEQDGVVGVFESQDHLNLDAIGRLGGSGPNPALTRNTLGEPIRIANQFLNLDSRTIEGIDLSVDPREVLA